MIALTSEDEILEKAQEQFPDADIRITPEQPGRFSLLLLAVYDLSVVAAMTWLAWKVTPWALFGLFALGSASADYHIEIIRENGQKSKAGDT